MALLTRRFQKLLVVVTLLLSASIVIIHYQQHGDVIYTSLPKSSQESLETLKQSISYYQELMKQYTSSFYSDETTEKIESIDEDAISKIQKLSAPAFSDSITPKDVLLKNVRYWTNLLKQPIDEPKLKLSKIQPDHEEDYKLENATFVSLVRNSELKKIKDTILQIEDTFNKKYHYPYVFLNDKPFTDNFKESIQKITKSKCYFELVDSKDWNKPSFIDPEREKKGIEELMEKGVGYSSKLSYHNMCRYYSKGFYNHERLQNFKYYWRIEPSTNYFCDIDYDVFKFMRENDKIYGFVINLYDSPDSVKSLWPTTLEFLAQNPQYLNENSADVWLRENLQNPENYQNANGYSTCHFWSNFEIGDMDFYRGEAYTKWVEHLDLNGGFYYERWGDAPVHSIGLGLFADKSKIHWFRDIGYEHMPYFNCPVSKKCDKRCKGGVFSKFKNLNNQNCMATWAQNEMSDEDLNLFG